MTANRRFTKSDGGAKSSSLPTLDDVEKGLVSLDDYEIAHGEDVPAFGDAGDVATLSISDTPELGAVLEKARGKRGPQKAPVKERIGLRLDKDVVDYFRSMGPGWQGRINDALHALGPADDEQRPVAARCDDEFLYVALADGRQIRTPLWWYPFLAKASSEARADVELEFSGVWWPGLDEGVSIKGLLLGWKAPGAKAPGRAA
ncbi:BrnA antitoxin family protein [Rhizobium sp. S152]|uniref:BrnA antitoxin family protein n=1 Tax=Rhizobium sp. S152 TaxID=3055038 RepID=UPI003014DD70